MKSEDFLATMMGLDSQLGQTTAAGNMHERVGSL
jgi:hypothetical protein